VALRAEALSPEKEATLSQVLRELLPDSMLFLRNLDRVVLLTNDAPALEIQRLQDGGDVIVQLDGQVRSWRRLTSAFELEAADLRSEYPGKIEDKRSASVTVAFTDTENDGRLFAWLPTQERSGLSCHIHGDFFPTNDRKHLLWEADYRSEWNRAALRAAARAIASNTDQVKSYLGPRRFWELCRSASELARSPAQHLRCFWSELLPALRGSASVFTSRGGWVLPGSATVVDPTFRDCLPALQALGIEIVHEDLDSFRNLLTERADGLGVRVLRLPSVVEAIQACGVQRGTASDVSAKVLADPPLRSQLWQVLDRMLASPQAGSREDRDSLARLPCVTSTDGRVMAPAEVFRTDSESVELLSSLGLGLPLLGEADTYPQLRLLSPELSAEPVVSALERNATAPGIPELTDEDRKNLLRWFAKRQDELERQPRMGQRLAALPIFPSGQGFKPLRLLSLPGAFEDPLGVAEVVDVASVRAQVPFLQSLGARELSLPEYVKRHVPQALTGDKLTPDLRRRLVALLADRLGELQDDAECRRTLTEAPIVECRDGAFVVAGDAYFDVKSLALLPAAMAKVAVVPPDREQAVGALFEWLGVASAPRLRDLRALVAPSTSQPPTAKTRDLVREVFEHLGARLVGHKELPDELTDLATRPWLPAQNDETRWWPARELAASFNQELFASQAAFLDVDRDAQGRCSDLINLLGIQRAPTVAQVARHLWDCARKGIPVKDNVYRTPSEEKWSQDPALEVLVGTKCIYLPDHGYVLPLHVFWADPGFGKYRFTLSDALRNCARFLDRVGVRPAPGPSDAIEVLLDIAKDPSLRGQRLEGVAAAVVGRCWTMLADAHRSGTLVDHQLKALSDQPVIADAAGLLNRPDVLFFEDRPNLAAHFRDSLGSNVIPLPDGVAAAMEAAGVRRLSRHLSVELLEPGQDGRSENFYIPARLRDRLDPLRRAAAASGLPTDDSAQWARLDDIRYEAATGLLVRYTCDVLGRVRYSSPQPPRAIFLPQDDTLLVEFRDGQISWPDVSRELALVVYPDLEPGRVSGAFVQVLAAQSPEEADDVLDALGVPRITFAPPAIPPAEPPVDDIGGHEEDIPPFVPPAPPGGTTGPPFIHSTGRKKSRPRSRYVTYVVPDDATPSGTGEGEGSGANRQVEEAGVRRARWAEEEAGRIVTVMPPNHPGYDLESRLEDGGEVERYIEVKALSDVWGADGVGLTVTEFNRARELGDRYWLYVVERATGEDYEIYRIQDPARKANWFFFDRGWSQASVKGDTAAAGGQVPETMSKQPSEA
jgi:hypothetical protein